MVRAGVVDHPQMWPFCGCNEIQNPPRGYRIIDLDNLARLSGFTNLQDFQSAHKSWIDATLSEGRTERESDWTQSLAVGGKSFVKKAKKRPRFKAKSRIITGEKGRYQLREETSDFGKSIFNRLEPNNGSSFGMDNTIFWNDKS